MARAALLIVAVALTVAGCGREDPAPGTAASPGSRVAAQEGCAGCHSTDGTASVGPTWEGLAGSRVPLADGSTVVADRAYLTRSIEDPSAQRVAGFAAAMPEIDLTDEQVADLVDYIESLSG